MKKGKSIYKFKLNCDMNAADQLVKNFLNSNSFVIEQKNGEAYYKARDGFIGYRYFNYDISNNNLIIYAWLKGAFGEIGIEQNGILNLNMMIMDYRNSLNILFNAIQNLNNNGGIIMNNNTYDPNNGQTNYQNNQETFNNNQQLNNTNNNQNNYNQNNNQFTETFQNETTKKQEKLCEIGFWLSLLGLIASFGGVSYGLILYIMNFYFASQGLKTRKKKKAIATIILSIISILIIIFSLMSN